MPTYQIRGLDGNIYQIEGPEGASKEEVKKRILARAPQAGVAPQEQNALEKSGWLGDLAASAADIPLSFVEGLAGTGKTFTDVFGAGNVASQGLDYILNLAESWKSSESRQDAETAALIQKEAEDKGVWEQVKAAIKSFSYSPLETTASLAGSAVPFIAGAVASEGAAVPAMLGLGAASGVGTIKGDIYDAMYSASLKHGANEDQARAAAELAQSYGGGNTDQIALGGFFGAAASATGLPRQIASAIGREAAEQVTESIVRKSVLKGTLKGAAEEAIPEAAQAGQERYAQNVAEQRAGYETDPWAGVAGQAAFEGIASLVPGAYGGRKETRAHNRYAVEEAVNETAATFAAGPTEEAIPAAMQRFINLGFQPDEARKVVANIAQKTQDLAARQTAMEEAAQERAAPVDEEALFAEPDITQPAPMQGEELTPPPVDAEEQAAMQQFYEQGYGEEPQVEEPMAPPPQTSATRSTPLTPDQAQAYLDRIEEYPYLKENIEAEAGLGEDQLSEIAAGPMLYSRRGRPAKDQRAQLEQAGQESLFGGLATQAEPVRNKREELIQQKLDIAPEERTNLLAQNMAAAEQRMAEAKQRNEEARAAKVEEIAQAVRSAHPANEAYQVTYTPDQAKPYQVRGPDGELFVAEDNLGKFEEAANELLPYTPAPESAQAVDEGGFEPTVATSMVQELIKEIDSARNAGKIDNNQRSQLLNQVATLVGRVGKGQEDDVAKLETKAREAASEFRNARGLDAKAAEIKLADANDKLRKFVESRVTKPTSARLKSMVENRQLEREGAGIRVKEAQGVIQGLRDKVATQQEFAVKRDQRGVKYERVPGVRPEGTQVGMEGIRNDETAEAKAAQLRRKALGTAATNEAVFGELNARDKAALVEAKREVREAKIDIAETKVTKFKRGEAKRTGISRAAAEKVAKLVTAQWKSKNAVNVVQSIEDITDKKLKAAIRRDGAYDAKGFVAPNGDVYLVADNLDSEAEAKATLFHEGLGHIGLAKLFRDSLDDVLTTLYRENKALKAETDKWLADNPDAYTADTNQLARAVEEVLAERSEKGPLERSLFQRLASLVRDFARKLGFKLNITDSDVQAILSMAHDQVINGPQESTSVKGMRYITSSAAFKKWFAGSKIVYADGTPVPMFHRGTFDETRDIPRTGMHFGTEQAANDRTVDKLILGNKLDMAPYVNYTQRPDGRWRWHSNVTNANSDQFVPEGYGSREEAQFSDRSYAEYLRSQPLTKVIDQVNKLHDKLQRNTGVALEPVEAPALTAVYLSIKNPKLLEDRGIWPEHVINEAKNAGYDGIVYHNMVEDKGSVSAIAFYPEQIKSVNNYGGFSTADPRILYARPKVSPKLKTKLEEQDASMSTAARRMAKSINVGGMNNGLEDALKAHGGEGVSQWMKDNYQSVNAPFFRTFLKTMLTSDILKSFGKAFTPDKAEESLLPVIDTAVHRMSSMRTNISRESDKLHRRLSKHTQDYGNTVMAKLMGEARISGISPDEFDSLDKALTDHRLVKEITKNILKNANDKAKAKDAIEAVKNLVLERKDRVEKQGDKTTPSAATIVQTNTLTKDAIDNKQTKQQVEQLAEAFRRIRDVYTTKAELEKQKGGLQLYKDLREYYKDMFEAELALLDERINTTLDEVQATRLRDRRAELMREITSPEKRQKAGDVFYNLDADLLDKDYFPFMREGKYWLRIIGDKNGTREREFHTFYTAGARDAAMRRIAQRLRVDLNAEESKDIIQVGNSLAELQKKIDDSNELMKLVFDTVEKARTDIKTGGSKDIDDLFNDITQVWLQSAPERYARRRLMHADEVVGMSQDILTHFQDQSTLYANQLSKMMYAHDLRMRVSELRDFAAASPTNEQARLRMIVDEIETRVEDEINPRTQSAVVNALNRASYVWYLTSAATAMVQTTTIPIRVMPRLWADYGFAKGNLMWLKYLRVWKSLGKPKVKVMHPSISDELHAIMPTIKDSDLINKGDPARVKRMQYAKQQGMARNILETVSDTLLQNERSAPVSKSTGAFAAIKGASLETVKIAGVGFNAMENMTRQATYFMTFELAYDKYKADNPKATEEEALEHAVNKATNTVRDTNGDFTSWERPSLTKNEWTRAFFLFKLYPLIQTSWFVRSTAHIIKGVWPGSSVEAKAQRNYAMKEMAGVMLMAGMFGGLAGLPLYSLMTYLFAAMAGPDGDDEDIKEMIATGADPRTAYDPDTMFRGWLMDRFGTPKVNDKDFADILINGPVSVLSDTDVGSRTSLDLVNMWFREAIAGDSASATILKTLIANFAGGQMAVNFVDAAEAASEGDMRGFITKGLPAFMKAPATAAYNANMGVTDRKGNTIIPKADLTALDAVRSLLGFRTMSLARHQDYVITRAKGEKEIQTERNKIFDRMNKAIYNGDIKTRDEFLKFWEEEVVPFNRTYPDPDLIIEEGDLIKSYKGSEKSRAMTVQGMKVNKKTGEQNLRAASKFMIKDPFGK